MSRKIFWILITIAALISSSYLISRFLAVSTVIPPGNKGYVPDIELAGAKLDKLDKDGKKIWELKAKSIAIQDSETMAEEVDIHFFKDDNKVLIVRADEILLQNRSGDFTIHGNIFAHNNEGLEFYTEEAHWDAERKILESETKVLIKSKNMTLTGVGFKYWPDEGKLKVKEEAFLTILP